MIFINFLKDMKLGVDDNYFKQKKYYDLILPLHALVLAREFSTIRHSRWNFFPFFLIK